MRWLLLPLLLLACDCAEADPALDTSADHLLLRCTWETSCNRAYDPEHKLCPHGKAWWCRCPAVPPAHCQAVDDNLVCCLPLI